METSEHEIIIREIVEVELHIARLQKQQKAETALRSLRDQLALSNSEATRDKGSPWFYNDKSNARGAYSAENDWSFSAEYVIYEKPYKRLLEIVPEAENPKQYGKSKVAGFMNLNFDLIEKSGNCVTFALSHYYQHPSGDLIADPDMCIRINRQEKTVEALSYRDTYCYELN